MALKRLVFDIETKNFFQQVGSNEPSALDISLVGIFDSATNSYSSYLEAELPALWPILEQTDLLIGFNSNYFDIPLLNKYYPGDLTKIKSLDILEEIRSAYGRRMRLDQLAEGTLGVRKSGHGLEAVKWWREGEIEKIREYCLDDVKITKELYDFARANNLLKFKEGGAINEIKLDATGWESESGNALTHTLPF